MAATSYRSAAMEVFGVHAVYVAEEWGRVGAMPTRDWVRRAIGPHATVEQVENALAGAARMRLDPTFRTGVCS